jgi:hypothetical protein
VLKQKTYASISQKVLYEGHTESH